MNYKCDKNRFNVIFFILLPNRTVRNLTENSYNTIYINMSNGNLEHLIQYNVKENSVNVPFGWVVEYYLKNHPLLKNIHLKCQSRKRTSKLVKAGIISIECIEETIDFIE